MKIYDTPQQPSSVAAGRQAQRTDATSTGKTGGKGAIAHARGDEVSLSALASGELDAAGGAHREERVAALASVYGRGAYAVDAESVASSMIDDATRMP